MININEFFNMGGYGYYVWASYGIALLVLTYPLLKTKRQSTSIKKRIERENLLGTP